MTMMPEHWVYLLLVGLCSGVVSSTMGVGAGIIMVPALAHLSFAQKEAQGIALAVMVPMALVGAIRYRYMPDVHIDTRVILLVTATGIVGALAGTQLVTWLIGLVLRRLFALLLIGVGVRMLLTVR